MPFDAPILTVVGLIEIALPERTLRLSDGGFVYMGGDKFASVDEEFGAIESVEAIGEGGSDDAPAGQLTFLPASTAAAVALSSPAFQNSPIRVWIAEVDPATGQIDGTPELEADLLLDTTDLVLRRGKRMLEMGFITASERMMSVNEGNVLSDRFHQAVWPGETGLASATGVATTEPWGVESPPRSYDRSSSGGGGTGGTSGVAPSYGGSVYGGGGFGGSIDQRFAQSL